MRGLGFRIYGTCGDVILVGGELTQEQTFSGMEMPGGNGMGSWGAAGDATVMLIGIESRVPLVRRHGICNRRLRMLGSDGHYRDYTVQTSQNFLQVTGR